MKKSYKKRDKTEAILYDGSNLQEVLDMCGDYATVQNDELEINCNGTWHLIGPNWYIVKLKASLFSVSSKLDFELNNVEDV